MGLTMQSVGKQASERAGEGFLPQTGERVVAIAGNPNVGKSTVFNGLTGLNQHTGNWPGKTVTSAVGRIQTQGGHRLLVDIPGTYSLFSHSREEEVARDFLFFRQPDGVVIICDSTCLERNLNLVLQVLEITDRAVVCVNLLDEAERKGIRVDTALLSRLLGVPVVGTVARNKKSLSALLEAMDGVLEGRNVPEPFRTAYEAPVETALQHLEAVLSTLSVPREQRRFLALRLLLQDRSFLQQYRQETGVDLEGMDEIRGAQDQAWKLLEQAGIQKDRLEERIVSSLVACGERIAKRCVQVEKTPYSDLDRRLDRVLTGRKAGYPLMLGLLCLCLWITISGANLPSQWLSNLLFSLEPYLRRLLEFFRLPPPVIGLLVDGGYRVLAWVIAVMLPPMAIFFPLFTLLEDTGYLPRIAYNLDGPFARCRACGKQALTMWVVDGRLRLAPGGLGDESNNIFPETEEKT